MYSNTYKRYITLSLLVIYILNRTDLAIFDFLMEPIKRDLGLSDTQLGFLAGPALVLFYATLGIPIARLGDRSNRINIISVAITAWSVMVMLTATVGQFWHLALARVGVGIGEAGFSAIALSLISDYHTPEERTKAMSVFMLGIPLGVMFSSLFAGWIDSHYGWRTAFVLAGLPGIVLAVVAKSTFQEPARGAGPAIAPVAGDRPPLTLVFVTLWRRRALRHLAISMTLCNLVTASILSWMAPFFVRTHHMTTGELGPWLAAISGLGGGVGMWLSGNLAKQFNIRNERAQARLLALGSALVCPMVVIALLWPTKWGALFLMFPAAVLMYLFFAPSSALLQGLCTANMRATTNAIVILAQTLLAGVVGVQLVGTLSDALSESLGTDALRWSMVIVTPAALWAATHYWLAANSIRQDLVDMAGEGAGVYAEGA